ncbi:MAG: FkbM family methyltransferase [Synechococcales bacterium]|nr:FkbM family methyltransferase [Synechococcales bacterium]
MTLQSNDRQPSLDALAEAGNISGAIAPTLHPDDWLYHRTTLEWVFQTPLGQQLPPLYQLFRAYCYLYFSLTVENQLRGGRLLFKLLSQVQYRLSPQGYLKFSLKKYEAFLDPFDPRCLQVVNELSRDDSDVKVLEYLLSEGDSFIDVGANHGSFSIVASKLVGSRGSVTAIEPQPRLARAVEKSLALNALGRFQVYPVAVGAFDGEIELLVPQGSSGAAGIYSDHSAVQAHATLPVAIRKFDTLLDWRSLPGQVVVKLDIEGSELAFLAGAQAMLTTLKPRLILEVHPGTLKAAGKTGADLKKALQDLGYGRYAEVNKPEVTFPMEDLNTQFQRNVIALQ